MSRAKRKIVPEKTKTVEHNTNGIDHAMIYYAWFTNGEHESVFEYYAFAKLNHALLYFGEYLIGGWKIHPGRGYYGTFNDEGLEMFEAVMVEIKGLNIANLDDVSSEEFWGKNVKGTKHSKKRRGKPGKTRKA